MLTASIQFYFLTQKGRSSVVSPIGGISELLIPSRLSWWPPPVKPYPSPRLSSIIKLSPTTSVANFLLPSLSSQLRVLNRPSIYTRLPLWRYFCDSSARPLQSTTVCHSVCETSFPPLSL